MQVCLGLTTLGPRRLYKKMEGNAFIYRSLYAEHLKRYSPTQPLSSPCPPCYLLRAPLTHSAPHP